jgi:hypothetical protein
MEEEERTAEVEHSAGAEAGRWRCRLAPIARELWLPASFLLVCVFLNPFGDRFELDRDEGINLMKGMLVARGHGLYGEIWSDQPPVFTFALAGLIKVFGVAVNPGRVLVLLSSCALLWAAGRLLREVGGEVHAASGGLLILLLPNFAKLSVSVMVGLPAISLAAVSLACLVTWHRRRSSAWLVASAVVLAFSVMTKAFTALMLPVMLLGLLGAERLRPENERWSQRLRAPGVWLACFGAIGGLLLVALVGPSNLGQLVYGHVAARKKFGQSYTVYTALAGTLPVLVLGGAGAVLAVVSRRWKALYVLAWALLAGILLRKHNPVWYHHQPLVGIPASLLAGCAVGEAVRWCRAAVSAERLRLPRVGVGVLVSAGIIWVAVCQGPTALERYELKGAAANLGGGSGSAPGPLAAAVVKYAPRTRWMVTDRPMYAFRAGLAAPPYLAVMSSKRLGTGLLGEVEIVAEIDRLKPEQVLLVRKKLAQVRRHLEGDYRVVYASGRSRLYVRRELVVGETPRSTGD